MDTSDAHYREHAVFSDLVRYAGFYRDLADGIFQFASMGTTAACNIDTYVFTAIAGTLDSTGAVLRAGQINDAYSLLRKYHDSIVINIYSNLYLRDHFAVEPLTPESIIVRQVNDWLHGKSRLPEFRVMSQYIRDSKSVKELNVLLHKDGRYKAIRDRCNDHTHYNYFANVMLNNSEVHLPNRRRVVDQFQSDLRDLFVLHLGYSLSVNDHYMMSGDYMDYAECGEQPPDECQFWVAPYVQRIYDAVLRTHRPDVADLIKLSTRMHLE